MDQSKHHKSIYKNLWNECKWKQIYQKLWDEAKAVRTETAINAYIRKQKKLQIDHLREKEGNKDENINQQNWGKKTTENFYKIKSLLFVKMKKNY